MGLVAELQGVAADGATFDVLQVVGGLVVELAIHCDQRIVAEELGDELGGVLLGGDDVHAVLGAREGDVEEAALFGVVDAVVAFDNVFEDGVFLDLGREAVEFVAGVDDDDVVVAETFGAVDCHKFNLDAGKAVGANAAIVGVVLEVGRFAEVECVKSVPAEQEDGGLGILGENLFHCCLDGLADEEIAAAFSFVLLAVNLFRVGLDDDGIGDVFRRDKGFFQLGFVLLDEAAGDVNDFLGIAVGLGDLQLLAVAHRFLELGEELDAGSGIGVDGLPVVSHGDNLGVADFAEGFREVETLPGNVLVLIHDDVHEVELYAGILLLPEDACGLVDHVLEVHGVLLLQALGVLQIALLADIQEELRALVGGLAFPFVELLGVEAVGLEILDECADQLDQLQDVFVLLGGDDFVEDFFGGAGLQSEAVGLQFFLKVDQQRPAVVVGGEGVDEFSAVLAVQLDLVIDGCLVAVQLLLVVPVVPAVLGDTEVLDVSHVVALGNGEVRGVGLVGTYDIVLVRLLVCVINLIEVQEVRNLDFLGRAQRFVGNGNAVAGALVDDLLRVLAHIPLERGEVRLGNVVEEGIEIIALIRRVKVAAEEEDEFVHQFRLLQDIALEVVVDDVE